MPSFLLPLLLLLTPTPSATESQCMIVCAASGRFVFGRLPKDSATESSFRFGGVQKLRHSALLLTAEASV